MKYRTGKKIALSTTFLVSFAIAGSINFGGVNYADATEVRRPGSNILVDNFAPDLGTRVNFKSTVPAGGPFDIDLSRATLIDDGGGHEKTPDGDGGNDSGENPPAQKKPRTYTIIKDAEEAAKDPEKSKDDKPTGKIGGQAQQKESAKRKFLRGKIDQARQAEKDFQKAKGTRSEGVYKRLRDRALDNVERATGRVTGRRPPAPQARGGKTPGRRAIFLKGCSRLATCGDAVKTGKNPSFFDGARRPKPGKRQPAAKPGGTQFFKGTPAKRPVPSVADNMRRLKERKKQREDGMRDALNAKPRAGAGGVSLHLAARVDGIDAKSVAGAAVKNDRLVLSLGGGEIAFENIDPDFLAIAIRAIYGGEGLVSGKLLADEKNGIVLDTGRDSFGELVWRKEFLANPWQKREKGAAVSLSLGPGIGLLSSRKPSLDRVTYYGPIKDTRVGKILLEADSLMTPLATGIDGRTGLPLDPPKVEGFQTRREMWVREELKKIAARKGKPKKELTPAEKKKRAEKAERDRKRPWWETSGWYVWVPKEVVFSRNDDGTGFVATKTAMRLALWSIDETTISDLGRRFVASVTDKYDALAKTYRVLAELKEVTKAVSLIRWLKKNDIALDTAWAKSREIEKVETPPEVQDAAIPIRFEGGKPVLVKAVRPG